MPVKIALFGPNGQVGWELQRSLAPLGEVVALQRGNGGDLSQPDALAATLRALRPAAIVNAAAYTAVDKAESEPDLAHAINAQAPAQMAALADELGAWLIHYSTDYVFDGTGSAPRDEASPTAPLSVYGRSKLEGEQAIVASGCLHLILRTSWVHAARGGNFARTMLKLAAERPRLTVVDDQVGAPTGADLLADVSAHLLRQVLPHAGVGRQQPDDARALAGIYHAVAGGETSWCGYARHVLAWARAQGIALQVGPDDVAPVPSSAYPSAAARPLNSRLDTNRLRQTFGLTLPDWRVGVERMLRIAFGAR